MTATSAAFELDAPRAPAGEACLHTKSWDRILLAGGALLVPIPIVAFVVLRSLGFSVAVAGDLVTLLVMVPLGGPHVYATFTRTFLTARFRREERALFLGSFGVFAVVVTAAVTSAFFDVELGGSPPMRYLLTFFFFWAGVHVAHQHSYVVACLRQRGAAPPRDRFAWVDYAVILLALYPVALFRMSMAGTADGVADPQALATRMVVALGASPGFVDDYLFRIGRVAPILPEFLLHPACWMLATAVFAACVGVFAWRAWQTRRRGQPLGTAFWVVACAGVTGFLVPAVPHLDSGFQGINAWHSFQYLGLVWLMNHNSAARREQVVGSTNPLRYYATAVGATAALITVILLVAFAIATASGGEFAMLGHDQPPRDPASGRVLYRPGSVLLSYYLVGFGVLLVHYFLDGAYLFRRRQLRAG